MAQRLVPGEPEDIDVQRLPGGVVARYRVGGVLVTLEFIRPDGDGQVPFRATAVGGHGVISRDIVLGADYVQPGVDAFAGMLATRATPIPTAQLLARSRCWRPSPAPRRPSPSEAVQRGAGITPPKVVAAAPRSPQPLTYPW